MENIIVSFLISLIVITFCVEVSFKNRNKKEISDEKPTPKYKDLWLHLLNATAILFLTIQCFKNMQALN